MITSKLLAPMIRHLAKTMADALAKSPVDVKTAKQVEKILSNPRRLNRDLEALERINKGEMSPIPEGELIPGAQIAKTMEDSAADPNIVTNGGKGWDPETINHVKENNWRESEEVVQDLIDYDPALRDYVKKTPMEPQAEEGLKTSKTIMEPIILGADGLVKDGYKRINAIAKLGFNTSKVKVLASEPSNFPSVALHKNADDVILERIGGFVDNLNLLVYPRDRWGNLIKKPKYGKLKTMQETKVSGTFPPKSRMGVAMALKTATTLENGDSVLDEPLMAGIAVDILKVLKDNKGGREGGQVFEHGGQQYLKPKNMNKLQEDIGKAVERRILKRIEDTKRNEQGPGYDPNKDKDLIRKITPEDRSALASGLITMARGNFGQNRNPIRNRNTGEIVYRESDIPLMGQAQENILSRPSLIS